LVAAIGISLGIVAGIGMLASGFLSVAFYRRRNPGVAVGLSSGTLLGALSGVFAFAISVALQAVTALVLGTAAQTRDRMLDFVKLLSARTADPQMLALFEYLRSPEGATALVLFILLSLFFAFLIFSSIGGALGGAFFRRRR
jgi:hypothetical protein